MSERRTVNRNVALTLGIICILLIGIVAYFSVTGISAQNNYNNLQNQNKQLQANNTNLQNQVNHLQTWLNGNETLLNQTQGVAGASSLQFSADITAGGVLTTYTYSAKNIGTSDAMLRIEWTSSGSDNIYIINGAQKQVWIYADGAWTNYSDYYTIYFNEWNSTFTGLRNSLVSHWFGSGDYTYTDPFTGDIVRLYNVSVNPSLADSLFQHS